MQLPTWLKQYHPVVARWLKQYHPVVAGSFGRKGETEGEVGKHGNKTLWASLLPPIPLDGSQYSAMVNWPRQLAVSIRNTPVGCHVTGMGRVAAVPWGMEVERSITC